MQRFDQVELEAVPVIEESGTLRDETAGAPRVRRFASLLIDLSLFVALAFLLSPLLPRPYGTLHVASIAGFVVMLSYYYFVGSWMLGGKTLGGVIFEVRVVPEERKAMSLRDASLRWAGVYVSIATLGLGFAMAALPSRRSLPDRISQTHCV